jgi:hypothetical protein
MYWGNVYVKASEVVLSLISLSKREILYKWRAFPLSYTLDGRSNADHGTHA